jgi:hypothetical protein
MSVNAQAYIFIGVQDAFSGLPGSIKDYQWLTFPARPHSKLASLKQ